MKRQVVLIGMGVMGKRHKERLLKKGFEITKHSEQVGIISKNIV